MTPQRESEEKEEVPCRLLCYYENATDGTPNGVIRLEAATTVELRTENVEAARGRPLLYVLRIRTDGKDVDLGAETNREARDWVDSISKAIRELGQPEEDESTKEAEPRRAIFPMAPQRPQSFRRGGRDDAQELIRQIGGTVEVSEPEEPSTQEYVLWTGSGETRAAPLDTLIDKLTDERDKEFVDGRKIEAILMTHTSFTNTEDLLVKFLERFQYLDGTGRSMSQVKCLNVLCIWVREDGRDLLRSDAVRTLFEEFFEAQRDTVTDAPVRAMMMRLEREFSTAIATGSVPGTPTRAASYSVGAMSGISSHDAEEGAIAPSESESVSEPDTMPDAVSIAVSPPLLSPGSFRRNFSVLSISTDRSGGEGVLNLNVKKREVGQQLTLLGYSIFSRVRKTELLNKAWTRNNKDVIAPNVRQMINFSTRLTHWVIWTVVKERDLKRRKEALRKSIKLGHHLLLMRNFDGVFAIASGLGSSAVHRLKATWELLGREATAQMEDLQELVKQDGARRNYRAALLEAVDKPTLPYLGSILADLIGCDEGNVSILPTNLQTAGSPSESSLAGKDEPEEVIPFINVSKLLMTADIIKGFLGYQRRVYPFGENTAVKAAIEEEFDTSSTFTPDDLYDQSLECEPRRTA